MSGHRHAPAALGLQKWPPVPVRQEAGWALELIMTQRLEEKSFASAGDRTPVVPCAVRHYTDWATPAAYIWPVRATMKFPRRPTQNYSEWVRQFRRWIVQTNGDRHDSPLRAQFIMYGLSDNNKKLYFFFQNANADGI